MADTPAPDLRTLVLQLAQRAGMTQLHGATFPGCAMTPEVLEAFYHYATEHILSGMGAWVVNDTIMASVRAEAASAALEQQPDTLRQAIGDLLGCGSAARTDDVLLASIGNALRRASCLGAIEREFFTRAVPDEDDDALPGDMVDECQLNWGAEPAEYVEQFRAALAAAAGAAQVPAGDWQQYAKGGETAQDVIERERADSAALLKLLAQERARITERAPVLCSNCAGTWFKSDTAGRPVCAACGAAPADTGEQQP